MAESSESSEAIRQIKSEIMYKVMQSILYPLKENASHLNNENTLDLLFSILVMTNREVLVRIITISNSRIHTKKILKNFFEAVDSEVRSNLEEFYKGMH